LAECGWALVQSGGAGWLRWGFDDRDHTMSKRIDIDRLFDGIYEPIIFLTHDCRIVL
jgi:hypothetical protein